MKVSCEHCGAAYAVADNKVAGRSLTLRCRKCGAPMPVDGRSRLPGGAGAPALRPSTPPVQVSVAPIVESPQEDAVWHIAVGDTTQGPYTLDELAMHYSQGSVVLETLVFRDGWANWQQASDIVGLTERARALAMPRRAAPPPVPVLRRGLTADGVAAMGSDPFAEPVADSPRVNAGDMLVPGRRHEGTVQFSVDQIRALSAISLPSVAPPARRGFASGEGSGLIDMRSLPPPEEVESPFGSIGNVGLSPLDTIAPLSLPSRQRAQGLDTKTKAIALVAVFGFALAGVGGVIALLSTPASAPGPAPVAAAQPSAAPIVPAAAPAPNPTALAAITVLKRSAPAEIAAAPAERESRSGQTRRQRGRRPSSTREASEERESRKSSSASIDDVLASAPKLKKSSEGASIDELLEGAVNGKRSAPKTEPQDQASSLPMTPGRDAMLAALGRAKAKAASCKGSGVATAAIKISGKSGRAMSVSVSGVDGSAKGCVEKAVRGTSFPKFQKDSFDVKFPFKLG